MRLMTGCLARKATPLLAPAAAAPDSPPWLEDDWFFDQSPAHDEPEALVSDS